MSKMLQNKINLLWETLKHFHAICKKHAFVAVAGKNRPVSPATILRENVGWILT